MALPKLNTTFAYDMTLPLNGKTYKYRPYLVQEEKMLLVAGESKDPTASMKAMRDILNACVQNLRADDLAMADVEYAFIQLRAKAAGEVTTVQSACDECEHVSEITINLEDIVVLDETADMLRFTVGDSIGVTMRHPTLQDVLRNPKIVSTEKSDRVDSMFTMIDIVIDTVEFGDECEKFSAQPLADRTEFVGTMNQEQFSHVRKFLEAMPSAKLPISFKCPKCGHVNEKVLTGIQNFFG